MALFLPLLIDLTTTFTQSCFLFFLNAFVKMVHACEVYIAFVVNLIKTKITKIKTHTICKQISY